MVTVVTVLLFAYSPGGKVELLLLLWVGRKCPLQLPYLSKATKGSYPSPYWVKNHDPLSFKLKAKESVAEEGSHKIQLTSQLQHGRNPLSPPIPFY